MNKYQTVEGYKVIRITNYPQLCPSIYRKEPFKDEYETGALCGAVVNPDLDDRFNVEIFCIWNSEGICVKTSGEDWGIRDYYKLITFNP